MGEWVEVQGPEGAFDAYVARPAGAVKGAVVVLQEIFGVNTVIRGKADWLAREGFLAIAPDLFWRRRKRLDITDQSEGEWKTALEEMNALDKDKSVKDIAAAIAKARAMGAAKVGVMGYCMGGYLAYLTAVRESVDAAIAYHGGGIHNHLDEAKNLRSPLLLHNPMKDGFIPVEALNTIREALKANPLVTVCEYAEHYDAAAARLADGRTAAFFKQHLA
jgi:carboxymethylenebutenolidase